MLKFVPADFKLIETRQPPLKDSYDEWLQSHLLRLLGSRLRIRFQGQSRDLRNAADASDAGRARPLKAWVKTALDQVVQVYLKQPDLSSFGSATTRSIRWSRRRR